VNVIDSVPLFASLTDLQRSLIWERMVLEKRKAGEHLFKQGEPATRLYLIKSGWARLVSDQFAVLANVSQGSLLGDADLLLGHSHGTSAEALTDLEAWGLADDDLAEIVAQQPEIGLQFSAIYRATVVPLMRYLVERRLRPTPGMEELPESVLATVAGRLCVHEAAAGEVLFTAGQAPTSLYIIDEGRVSMGEPERGTGEYGAGELLTERNVLLGRAHTLTAHALTDCRLWELSVSDLEKLCSLYPDLRAVLSRAVQSRVDAVDQSRAISLLRSTPIFLALPAEALAELAARLVWQMAPNGTRIFDATTPAEAMFLVEGGGVELVDQRNESLARISSGGYFGEAGLADGETYGYAAVARGNTTLWVLTRADVENVAERYPAVRRAVADYLIASQVANREHFAEQHLRRLSLFAGLTSAQLSDVAGHLSEARFRAGQPLFQRGQPGDALYLIEQGRVSIQTQTADGTVRTLAGIGSGEFCGETAILTGEPQATDALALTEVTAWMLTRQDFESLVMQYPLLALNLSRALSYRLRQSNEQGLGAPAETPGVPVAAAVVATSALSAAPRPAPAAARPPAPAPAKPAPASMAPAKPAAVEPARRGGPAAALAWFGSQKTGTKIQLIALVLLIIWLIGIAAPSLVISALSSRNNTQNAQNGKNGFLDSAVLVALAANSEEQQVEPIATYTPWPTETPIPTAVPTSTPTSTPTNTPIPATPTSPATATPEPPTATPLPPTQSPEQIAQRQAQVAAAAAAAATAAAPKPTPRPARQYSVKEIYHLTPCENGGKHNVFLRLVDPGGTPVDGVKILLYSGDMATNLGATLTGTKGPGLGEFDIYKNGAYAVVVAGAGNDPGDSEIATPLSSVHNLDGSTFPSSEVCASSGDTGNMWGHNSWRVTFVKNW
jgi:CRP-like cAMP-binding protein